MSTRKKSDVAWTPKEEELREAALRGETVLASFKAHPALVRWAKETGRYVYIGRLHWHGSTFWGNPYKLEDYPVEEAKQLYREHRLPSRMHRIDELRGGKVLVCHCCPKPCHGQVLIEALAAARR